MRLLACLFGLATVTGLAACQHADSAERSAEIVARTTAKPATAVAATAPALAAVAAPQAAPAGHMCGAGCNGTCGGGQCGGGCGGGGEAPAWTTPADAQWTALHVTGMHCGGCAKRIERALANVKGVVGVKADYSTAKVEIATAKDIDARTLVASTIDGLGYHVE